MFPRRKGGERKNYLTHPPTRETTEIVSFLQVLPRVMGSQAKERKRKGQDFTTKMESVCCTQQFRSILCVFMFYPHDHGPRKGMRQEHEGEQLAVRERVPTKERGREEKLFELGELRARRGSPPHQLMSGQTISSGQTMRRPQKLCTRKARRF